jgi:hypothetical protein
MLGIAFAILLGLRPDGDVQLVALITSQLLVLAALLWVLYRS